MNEIRSVEQSIRNSAAHTITYVTDDVIKNRTGYNAKTIFKKMKQLSSAVGVNFSDEFMRTYDKLNERICELLEK